MSFLSGNFNDCIAFNTVSQCPLFISATKPSTLSTVFNDTPVSSYKYYIILLVFFFNSSKKLIHNNYSLRKYI